MGRITRVAKMKISPLTFGLVLIIPMILISAGSRPKEERTSFPNYVQRFIGIWRCPQDVYSIWIYEHPEYRKTKADFELKVGSYSSFGTFLYHWTNDTWSVEDQSMSAHWYRKDLETMSWLVKKYQGVVNLELEEYTEKNSDCRKLAITFKDGSTAMLGKLGPIPDTEPKIKTTTTTTTLGPKKYETTTPKPKKYKRRG